MFTGISCVEKSKPVTVRVPVFPDDVCAEKSKPDTMRKPVAPSSGIVEKLYPVTRRVPVVLGSGCVLKSNPDVILFPTVVLGELLWIYFFFVIGTPWTTNFRVLRLFVVSLSFAILFGF